MLRPRTAKARRIRPILGRRPSRRDPPALPALTLPPCRRRKTPSGLPGTGRDSVSAGGVRGGRATGLPPRDLRRRFRRCAGPTPSDGRPPFGGPAQQNLGLRTQTPHHARPDHLTDRCRPPAPPEPPAPQTPPPRRSQHQGLCVLPQAHAAAVHAARLLRAVRRGGGGRQGRRRAAARAQPGVAAGHYARRRCGPLAGFGLWGACSSLQGPCWQQNSRMHRQYSGEHAPPPAIRRRSAPNARPTPQRRAPPPRNDHRRGRVRVHRRGRRQPGRVGTFLRGSCCERRSFPPREGLRSFTDRAATGGPCRRPWLQHAAGREAARPRTPRSPHAPKPPGRPAIVISFVVGGISSLLSALCYAEFAAGAFPSLGVSG